MVPEIAEKDPKQALLHISELGDDKANWSKPKDQLSIKERI